MCHPQLHVQYILDVLWRADQDNGPHPLGFDLISHSCGLIHRVTELPTMSKIKKKAQLLVSTPLRERLGKT